MWLAHQRVSIDTRKGNDQLEAGIYTGTVEKGTVGERRSALAIEFTGECGHIFELRIQQHKGINIILAWNPKLKAQY